MENTYVSKAFLFDEQDLIDRIGEEPEDFCHLVGLAIVTTESKANELDKPFSAILGVCSERYNWTRQLNFDLESCWTSRHKDWVQMVRSIAGRLGRVNDHYLEDLLATDDLFYFMSSVSRQIETELEQRNYHSVNLMVKSLENLHASGLPCFRPD